jgi:Domain of unknown function (DUF4340)
MRMGTLVRAALLLAVAAAVALAVQWAGRYGEGRGLVGRSLLGPANVGAARIVLIETPVGQVTIRSRPWGWGVDELDGFPADVGKVRELLLAFANAHISQHVTLSADHMGQLGLLQKVENNWRFDAGKTASVLTLVRGEEHRHRAIFQVLVGNVRPGGGGTYVRFPDLGGAYLVPERLVLEGRAERWMEHAIFEPGAAGRLREVRVQAAGAAPLTLARAAPERPWRLTMPGSAAGAPAAAPVAELVQALANLRLVAISRRNAAPAADPGPASEAGARLDVSFFDGSAVTLSFLPPVADTPAATSAQGTEPGRRALLAARLEPDDAGKTGGASSASGSGPSDRARWEVPGLNRAFAGRVATLDGAQVRTLLRGAEAYRGP